jgi:hypothetical protein
MTRLLMVTILAAASLALGQSQAEKEKDALRQDLGPRVQKVFQVKHADVNSLWNAFNHIANVRVDQNLKLLVVSGTPEAVKAIEDALKTLDVPPPPPAPVKNIELTMYMILAKPAKNGSLPPVLESVQKNLEGLFGFKGFHLLETAYLRTRNGHETSARGIAPNPIDPASPQKVTYSVTAVPSATAGEKGAIVRIDKLRLVLDIPVLRSAEPQARMSFEMARANIETYIDVREGQKVVVGKTNVNATDGAMVLVVTANVVQ